VANGRYVYTLQDLSRRMVTTDMQAQVGDSFRGFHFVTYNDVWGNGTLAHPHSAAADAHFGAARAWDYFYQRHGRRGLDYAGSWVTSRVHYGSRFVGAFANGAMLSFGDGDGYTANPFVSVDIVGHEIGHSVIAYTIPSRSGSGLYYVGESGAANESFSDIFGTAIEFYTGIRPDYAIGEDVHTPYVAGDALRYMFNPPADGRSVDHYSRRWYPVCSPSPANDKCGVHLNSGIQNKAFYLLAAGGTHYGVTVPSITRIAAERIFYRALFKLHEVAGFRDVRRATQAAAADLFGASSAQYVATVRAWDAVGVPR
jgi:thermolysin